jgi:hypothetical protein
MKLILHGSQSIGILHLDKVIYNIMEVTMNGCDKTVKLVSIIS